MPKTYRFATLDSVIESLNQGSHIALDDVRPSLRSAWIHVGYRGMGGVYLPDSDVYARNRRAVVDAHCDTARMFDDYAARVPAGFRAALMRGESARSRDGRTLFVVDCVTVRDVASR